MCFKDTLIKIQGRQLFIVSQHMFYTRNYDWLQGHYPMKAWRNYYYSFRQLVHITHLIGLTVHLIGPIDHSTPSARAVDYIGCISAEG